MLTETLQCEAKCHQIETCTCNKERRAPETLNMWVNIKKGDYMSIAPQLKKKEPGKVNELTWLEDPYIL